MARKTQNSVPGADGDTRRNGAGHIGRHTPDRIHPGVIAAVRAARAALNALVDERYAAAHADPDAPAPAAGPRAADILAASPDPGGEPALSEWALRLALAPEVADSPLGRAAAGLELDAFETVVLALCLFSELDPASASAIGMAHGDRARDLPSGELAVLAATGDRPGGVDLLRALAPAAPLHRWRLLKTTERRQLSRDPLALDTSFLSYLLGEAGLDPELDGVARLVPDGQLQAVPPPPALATLLEDGRATGGADGEDGPPTVALLYGDIQAGLRVAAGAARAAGRGLLLIDAARVPAGPDGVETLRRALRAAVLHHALPCIQGAAALLGPRHEQSAAYRRLLDSCPAALPLLLLDADEAGAPPLSDRAFAPIPVAEPSVEERVEQWGQATAAHGIVADETTLRTLAETTPLSGSAVVEVAAAAARLTVDGADAGGRRLQQAARAATRARAGDDLTLVAPRYNWDDLVLPEDRLELLRHLCGRVRHRTLIHTDWELGRGRAPGVIALFTGEPGTGKSMAAEVVADDLGLDLSRIDLSQTVSKYIGETEKNLARLFDAAEAGGVVLVFDEADALFGKRSAVQDSHDRYANLETSYLLERLERFRGLAILTSNLGANLDAAFTRRISVQMDFPRPGVAERARLWERMLAGVPCDSELDLTLVFERLDLTGGEILNVAVTAAHLAAAAGTPLDGPLVARALRWESQKAGRLNPPEVLAALNGTPPTNDGRSSGARSRGR